jgi:hypothetical protein
MSTNGNHQNGSNGHSNGKAAVPIHASPAPHASAPFFGMSRSETAALYRAISHATFAEAEVRAIVRRMGMSLEGG